MEKNQEKYEVIDVTDQDEAFHSKDLLMKQAKEELLRIVKTGSAMDVMEFHHKYAPGLGHRKLGRFYLRVYRAYLKGVEIS